MPHSKEERTSSKRLRENSDLEGSLLKRPKKLSQLKAPERSKKVFL